MVHWRIPSLRGQPCPVKIVPVGIPAHTTVVSPPSIGPPVYEIRPTGLGICVMCHIQLRSVSPPPSPLCHWTLSGCVSEVGHVYSYYWFLRQYWV
ncbi:hypothetical protein KIPB_005877 [Kipferlia bialata]|uniref:Uncharacterized protein n=1 Tax=Kipferlia bialata TaxID=797122 RepID=A0A9K3CW62_9EUKA|nr:hypothetical protein KIPB_005877 [Kipferlia bialata]|eukprot:g5877.t1